MNPFDYLCKGQLSGRICDLFKHPVYTAVYIMDKTIIIKPYLQMAKSNQS